jgi:hypothetical protein
VCSVLNLVNFSNILSIKAFQEVLSNLADDDVHAIASIESRETTKTLDVFHGFRIIMHHLQVLHRSLEEEKEGSDTHSQSIHERKANGILFLFNFHLVTS